MPNLIFCGTFHKDTSILSLGTLVCAQLRMEALWMGMLKEETIHTALQQTEFFFFLLNKLGTKADK